jgi:putative oxidoreductase
MPAVGGDDVLIRVHSVAINQWDLRYRAGMLPPNPLPGRPAWPLPFQLGRDGAGEVVAVGAAVTRWKVGDRVAQMPHPACGHCAMCLKGRDNLCINTAYPGHQIFGSYAEYVVRPQHAVLPIPDHVSYELAAATLWAYSTPLNCAVRRAPVGVGDTVVITGASGGLATACAQLARLHGATVIGTTTKFDRADELMAIGYDTILDSADPSLPGAVKGMTGGLGADAVLGAPVTDEGFDLSISTLAFIFGELDMVGVRAASRADQELCMRLLAAGKITPVIDRVYPLAEAVEAHRYLESHQQIGKVLLAPGGESHMAGHLS